MTNPILATQESIQFTIVSDDGLLMPIIKRPYRGLELSASPMSKLSTLYTTPSLGDAEQALHACANSQGFTLVLPNGDELQGQDILDKFRVQKVKAITTYQFSD